MTFRSRALVCLLGALAISTLVGAVAVWRHNYGRQWWANFLAGDPSRGAFLFETKGCAQCHSVNQLGRQNAPDLAAGEHGSTMNDVVAAMWNHAPRMWDRLRASNIAYPVLDNRDMTHLFAYLYASRYVDEPGNATRGRKLFASKGCVRCHAVNGEGGTAGPDLAKVGSDTPIAWTQTMWNHAPSMEARIRELGLAWPSFQAGEMNDLLAYVREVSGGLRHEIRLLPADPDRGGRLFQIKACASCHTAGSDSASVGPAFGPGRELPRSIVQFSGMMWNHAPEMARAMKDRGVTRPTFEGREMADLIAYLYGLHYFESSGSAANGRSTFGARGCGNCHGAFGEGSERGPALRKRGEMFTSVTLATALWRHGPEMYQRCKNLGMPWPTLAQSDVGDLVSFLNAPAEEKR